jgi:hypothetical protein
LNAWLGGYESILKRMTPGNFNWFLHSMLFYHTQRVLKKQLYKASKKGNEKEVSEESEDEGWIKIITLKYYIFVITLIQLLIAA